MCSKWFARGESNIWRVVIIRRELSLYRMRRVEVSWNKLFM